jgi:hypothetical protein
VILYCHNCNTTHEFTAGQIERLAYTLQGQYADALCSDKIAGESYQMIPCLKDTLGESWDSECYLEFTSGQVECRQRLGREHRAQGRELLAAQSGRGQR